MVVERTELEGVWVLVPRVIGDARGWFAETFRADRLADVGVCLEFCQDNQSYSAARGTLRGIHFQNYPYAQSKLVRCLRGEILDIAVDLRSWSPNYKKWVGVVLSEKNKKQLLIPRGFGHAFLTLTDDVEVAYKVDEYYNKEFDRAIRFDDKDLCVDFGEGEFVVSDKDRLAPLLKDSDCNFGARILVTGANGQLGHDVVKLLRMKGIECRGVDIGDFDLTDFAAVEAYLTDYKPTAIVHCAAYTAVDRAEDERQKCYDVNVTGSANLARCAEALGASMVYVSTDYVYAGAGETSMDEAAPLAPKNYYGETKLLGEKEVLKAVKKHFILRTSWVFGRNGNNFVKTMMRLGAERKELSVVADQVGSPTYTKDLARLIVDMVFTDKYGIYNASNEGFCSWQEFATEIFAQACISAKANPVATEAYPTKAVRPHNSRLDKSKLERNGFRRLPDWKTALKNYLEEIK